MTLSNKTVIDNNNSAPIVTDEQFQIFYLMYSLAFTPIISIIGIVSNVINIVVFLKLGFSNRVNISFFALTISDLAILVAQSQTFFLHPSLNRSGRVVDSIRVQHLTSGVPVQMFSRATAWITLYIVIERFLCVWKPLQVKIVLTRERTVLIVLSIFLLTFASVISTMFAYRLSWTFDVAKNSTILKLLLAEKGVASYTIQTSVNFIVFQLGSFVAVVVLTVLLGIQLRRNTNWRLKVTRRAQESLCSRGQAAASTTTVIIAVIFIICQSPMPVTFVVSKFVPEFSPTGRESNLYNIIILTTLAMECLNSSFNIFIYVYTNTKYRQQFHFIFDKSNKP